MGFIKKTLAVSTLGASVVAEKSIKAAASGVTTGLSADALGKVRVQDDLHDLLHTDGEGRSLHEVKVHATGNTIEFKFRHDGAALFREQIEALILAYGTPISTLPAAAGPDLADQIRKLADLRKSSLLTAEEFDTKKSELLQGI